MNPPPPPPPPLPPGVRRNVDGTNAPMQLPPHLQAMMQQHVGTQDLRSELPMSFGSLRYYPGRGAGGGRGADASGAQGGQGGGLGRGGNAQRGRGRGGGRGGGGRGRGGNHYNNSRGGGRGGGNAHFKRKREPSDDMKDPSRFFLPSCLEDPWKHLEAAQQSGVSHDASAGSREYQQQYQQQPTASSHQGQPPSHQQQYQHYNSDAQRHVDRPGRVLFQPSFLADPWRSLIRS